MLNDLQIFFPNLPDHIVSGIPDSNDEMMLITFTNDTVAFYDQRIQQITSAVPISEYIICE